MQTNRTGYNPPPTDRVQGRPLQAPPKPVEVPLVPVYRMPKVPVTIAATSGCFDIIHAGHVYLFEWMRNAVGPQGQVVVLLNDDNYLLRAKGRVILPLEQRIDVLLAMRNVDMVIPFEDDDPALLVSRLEPDFWFKGPEYKDIDFPERSVLQTYGGQLVFVEFGPKVHTSDIIDKIHETADPGSFDAGALNSYGGGDVSWWHDYIRSILNEADEFYRGVI